MYSLLALIIVISPFARARVTTVQELRYLAEVLDPIATEAGYRLDQDSLSVHGYSPREEQRYGFRWWNTPAGNQDHTIIFRVTKGDVVQMRTIFFTSEATKVGRPCHLRNATSRRLTSSFDGHETCVTLYLKPGRKHVRTDPTMDNIRVAKPLWWDAFGSKRP